MHCLEASGCQDQHFGWSVRISLPDGLAGKFGGPKLGFSLPNVAPNTIIFNACSNCSSKLVIYQRGKDASFGGIW